MNTSATKQDFRRSPLFRKGYELLKDKGELIEFLTDHDNAVAAQASFAESLFKMPDGKAFVLGNQHYSALISYLLNQEDQELDLYYENLTSDLNQDQYDRIIAFETIMTNLGWERT